MDFIVEKAEQERMEINTGQLLQVVFEYVSETKADVFISHVKAHLDNNDKGLNAHLIADKEVGCTICGRTVEQIANLEIRTWMESIIGVEETDKTLKGTASEDCGK